MKTLSQNQKNFLLKYFFKNEKYPGWENVAIKLLNIGKCIVAGNTCIWIGGIGNFIKTDNSEDCEGCLVYTFDLEYFLTTEFYKEISNEYISILSSKKRDIEQEYSDICNL